MIRVLAGALAANRVLFGIGYIAAPERTGRGWIGRRAAARQTQVFTRALGARDLALGLGALAALRGGTGARSWFAAHAIADGTDLAATIAARDKLPPSGYRFATAMAGGSTAIAVAAALLLPRSRETDGR